MNRTSNVVKTIRMTYSILNLCGFKKENLYMDFTKPPSDHWLGLKRMPKEEYMTD